MNLSQLKLHGAIVEVEFREHRLEWKTPAGDAVSFSVSIRRPAYADVDFAQKADAAGTCPFNAAIISRCVQFGEGEFLKPEEAAQLESGLFAVLVRAVFSGSGLEGKKKPSRPPKSSGTSSS